MVCPKVVNRITRWVYDRNEVIGRLGRSMIHRLSRRLDRLPARTDTPGATPPRRVGGAPDSDQEGNSNHRREGAHSRSRAMAANSILRPRFLVVFRLLSDREVEAGPEG